MESTAFKASKTRENNKGQRSCKRILKGGRKQSRPALGKCAPAQQGGIQPVTHATYSKPLKKKPLPLVTCYQN